MNVSFREARQRAIASLMSGFYRHEYRDVRRGKNLLEAGDISPAEVIGLLQRCRGTQHSVSPHHWDADVIVHVFKPSAGDIRWYIKLYFLDDADDSVIFISVHHQSDSESF
jgi:hypothetical protein